jgi:hypothetical protein
VNSTQSLITVRVPQFFRISGSTNLSFTKTLSAGSGFMEAGYYEAANLADINADLVPDNIKSGATIFGTTGTYETASSPSADLTQAQVDALAAWADQMIAFGSVANYSPGEFVEGELVDPIAIVFNTDWWTIASFTPLLRGGLINTEVKIRVNSVFEPGTVEAQIRVNNVPAGTILSTSSETDVILRDFSLSVSSGDVLSLSIRHSASNVGSVTSGLKILVSNPTVLSDTNPSP